MSCRSKKGFKVGLLVDYLAYLGQNIKYENNLSHTTFPTGN